MCKSFTLKCQRKQSMETLLVWQNWETKMRFCGTLEKNKKFHKCKGEQYVEMGVEPTCEIGRELITPWET